MAKDECFALNEYGRCNALVVGKCIGYDNCAFYKTKKQNDKDKKKAEARATRILGVIPYEQKEKVKK